MNNTLFILMPYKYAGAWVFDDPAVGLVKEPFVAGADTMMDRLVSDIPDAAKGFRLIFSTVPFPGYAVRLEWSQEEYGGNWYRWAEARMEGWLCPALFKYFPQAPAEIYVRAEARHLPEAEAG